ncbi:uncharacterized protein N7446_001129 [Penicillium canescens]|uniref:uncharacterized protein n=1 Tax=Penicillium canescens TaxID=5083 RepID=UPI0026DECBAF|nr:uncharacterized protein N7446_001129 [Penicillium canescens]KAJ6060186.1 hypothetical protein N7444_002040 [Penicillium canescens]KAJ6078193.1 hypothetical protein N7446_001129 [Penicillium canescens]
MPAEEEAGAVVVDAAGEVEAMDQRMKSTPIVDAPTTGPSSIAAARMHPQRKGHPQIRWFFVKKAVARGHIDVKRADASPKHLTPLHSRDFWKC